MEQVPFASCLVILMKKMYSMWLLPQICFWSLSAVFMAVSEILNVRNNLVRIFFLKDKQFESL